MVKTLRGYRLFQKYHISCDVSCVVNAHNVQYPVEVYRFFRQINVQIFEEAIRT